MSDVTDGLYLLTRDLRASAADLSRDEARFIVDAYYALQDFRISAANQTRALSTSGEPHATVSFFANQFETLENQLKSALDTFSRNEPMGKWARGHVGIGPVIAAGLVAHIDITRANTAGAIWRFAGLDPTLTWGKGQKRPYNAKLKVLCWKIGDSFVRQSARPNCFYGHLYRERKEYEVQRDVAGGNAETAKQTLEQRRIKDPATLKIYESGHLPPGRLDQRARRHAVKLFLAHWFEEAYRQHHGTEPPLPYPIAHLDHTHRIEAPST